MGRRIFIQVIGLATVLAVVAHGATIERVPAIRAQVAADYCPTSEEAALLGLINDHRTSKGRQPLQFSAPLGAAARHHAESMASFDYFDYTLVPENITFIQNIANFGYSGSYVGANIAAGPSSSRAAAVLDQWLVSPSQRENLLNPQFTAIGIGSAISPEASFVNYWVAAFGEVVQGPERVCATASPVSPAQESPAPTGTATLISAATATNAPIPTDVVPAATPARTASPVLFLTAVPARTATLATTPPSAASPVLPAPATVQAASPAPSIALIASPVSASPCRTNRVEARASQQVILSCTGFLPGEEVVVYLGEPRASGVVGTFAAGPGGDGELTFRAPEVPSGDYLLIARGSTSQVTATLSIGIRPGLFITPRSGDVGDVVTADLTGFQPGEVVTLNWQSATGARELRTVVVGEDGSLTTTFRAPAAEPGRHEIRAIGITGATASSSFEIEEE